MLTDLRQSEDFPALEILNLLQNVWCFDEEIKTNDCLWKECKNYLCWCEEHLSRKGCDGFAKWELPPLDFVFKKIKDRKSFLFVR